jgi:hypothetical protein
MGRGVLHFVQLAGGGGIWGIQYRRSRDLGETWDKIEYITPLSSEFLYLDPIIETRSAIDGEYVLAAWRDPGYGCLSGVGCTIVGRIGKVEADSTRWYPERILTTIPLGYIPALASSSNGFAAVWPMDHESSPFAQVRVTVDTAWGMAYDPIAVPATAATDLDVALSPGAVHVTWCQKTGDMNIAFRVMYRRGVLLDTGVEQPEENAPTVFKLAQNYPNPFNGETRIEYALPSQAGCAWVTMKVFDILGREVTTLVNEEQTPGSHSVTWDATGRATGVYVCRMVVLDDTGHVRSESRRMVLVR